MLKARILSNNKRQCPTKSEAAAPTAVLRMLQAQSLVPLAQIATRDKSGILNLAPGSP